MRINRGINRWPTLSWWYLKNNWGDKAKFVEGGCYTIKLPPRHRSTSSSAQTRQTHTTILNILWYAGRGWCFKKRRSLKKEPGVEWRREFSTRHGPLFIVCVSFRVSRIHHWILYLKLWKTDSPAEMTLAYLWMNYQGPPVGYQVK